MRRGPLLTADETAGILVETILADLPERSGHERRPARQRPRRHRAARPVHPLPGRAPGARGAGNVVSRSMVGDYITSLEMAGASVTVTRLDEELRSLLDDPARAARFAR